MELAEKKLKRYATMQFNTVDSARPHRPMLKSEMLSQDDPKSRPMLELREKLQPEVIELIKQQRLNRLCEGTCFRKISARRRQDKFWYCRLSPNHKVLHYGDIEEFSQGQISHDSLQEKVTVADIKAVVTGKDCPHIREKGALKNKYNIWTDGLNALLGKEMTSELTKSDMDTLVTMELKLRLLDLENIQIPDVPPPVPKVPSTYDFVYDFSQQHT
ncbi:engulfment and cell motility protein 1 isoform X4 [Cyprinus carpio]|uniref:Engulfment and cell motility protein 1 isoform X4 n=1 Tax=Cyprinus carpio TaxID=7962 RepID=A0A9R0AG70_CYPCA|nr:engulfment and cell motility protein 1 isoform X4 [Cyprinus carpio]